MDANTEISRVAIVGTGLIGSSWAACFLAHGLDVVATDPAPGTEDNVRQYVDAAWVALTKIGLAPGASTSRLRFESDLKEAVAGADLVQENAPEREPLKIKLFADMDSILPPPAILASSTSGIPMSRIQSECKYPERCVTGHPFNPPHLIPLVEVVGGAKTSAETIERVMRFYTAMGKRAMHIRKEVMGHVANRLQAALYREVAYLIDQDVVSVADADAAVCYGSGPALGSDGTEPDLPPGRWTGWYASLPQAIHESDDGVLDRSRLSRPSESRTAEKDCRRRAGGGGWPLIRGVIAGTRQLDLGTAGIALPSR